MTNFCINCPDREACATGYPCELVKRINPPVEFIVPPVFQYERRASLSQIFPFELRVPQCDGWCQYGDCDWRGCGGCCGCLGGCQVAYENQQIAPFLWEGDYA